MIEEVGLLGGDGAEQDIYLLGVKSAEQEFTGKVIESNSCSIFAVNLIPVNR